MRRSSRLAPQRVSQKKAPLWKGRRRNSYRRGRPGFKPASTGAWRRFTLVTLGAVGLASFCLGLVLLYYQLLTCSWFCFKDMKGIEIEGKQRLTRELILKQAGLNPQMSLLVLRPGRIERALLAHPWIAQAEVTRKWPQKLHLSIREREPVALVQLGELYYVDRQGCLFKPLSPGDPHDFPVITGLGPEQFSLREGPLPQVLAQVFQLLDLLKEAKPPLNLENISEVHVDLERGFTLYANGVGGAVDLGRADFPDKLSKFARVWPLLSQRGYLARLERINLDYPHKVLFTQNGGR